MNEGDKQQADHVLKRRGLSLPFLPPPTGWNLDVVGSHPEARVTAALEDGKRRKEAHLSEPESPALQSHISPALLIPKLLRKKGKHDHLPKATVICSFCFTQLSFDVSDGALEFLQSGFRSSQ